MHGSKINAYTKLGFISIKMELDTLCLSITKLRRVVQRRQQRAQTEPLGTPNKHLKRSDKVEPIFIN